MLARSKLKNINPIWYVLLAAFVVRVLVPLLALIITKDNSVFHSRDTISYIRPAMELLSSGQFASNGIPEIVRTPGHPLFLIPGILLNKTELVTIALQIVLSCLTVYLIFRIALILFDRVELAVLCALMYVIEPLSILYTSKLLTETLFTCLIIFFLYYLLMYIKNRSLNQLLISAIALAASVYVRPISYYLPLFITVVLLIWILTTMPKKSILLIHTCLFFFVSMGLIGLWQIRNKAETGYTGFSAITDINLYFYQGASVIAVRQGVPYYEMQNKMGYRDKEVYFLNHPEQRLWNQSKRYQYMRKEGIRILRNDPFLYSKIHLKGIIRTLLDPGAIEYLKLYKLYPESGGLLGIIVDKGLAKTVITLIKEKPIVFWINLLLGMLLALYFLFGVTALLSKNFIYDMPIITLLCVGIYFLIFSGGPNSLNRFRHPIMPFLCILAGHGLSLLFGKLILKKTSHTGVVV